MSQSFYRSEEVRSLARGNWFEILNVMAPQLEPALRRAGKHVACPVHGGKDGFRLYKDSHETGGAICNTCGKFKDGFELLMWLYDWDFKTVRDQVGEVVGAKEILIADKNSSSGNSKYQGGHKSKPESKTQSQIQKPHKTYDGVLVAFGKDHYNFKPENEQNYYAQVAVEGGYEKTMWGVDLERAIADANAQVGDTVVIKNLGREPVTVMVDELDDQGNFVKEKERKTHRNSFIVEVKMRANPQERAVPELKVVGGAVDVQSEGNVAQEEIAIPDTGLQQVHQTVSKVVPLFKQDAKPWLLEAKEKMEKQAERRKQYASKRAAKTLEIWESCLDYYNPKAAPMKRYLDNRNLACRMSKILESDCLRFHPMLPYYDTDGVLQGKHPAIVAAIRDIDGNIITLHRTYLTSNGKKAAVEEARKMISIPDGLEINGASIQLGIPTDGILGVAEGLETALSPYRATGIPTWSTVNSALMESFEPPENVHTVLIWADKDRSNGGERSAQKLKNRMLDSGRNCYILLPKMPIPHAAKGVDWNDVIMTQGIIGFPAGRYIKNFVASARGDSNES